MCLARQAAHSANRKLCKKASQWAVNWLKAQLSKPSKYLQQAPAAMCPSAESALVAPAHYGSCGCHHHHQHSSGYKSSSETPALLRRSCDARNLSLLMMLALHQAHTGSVSRVQGVHRNKGEVACTAAAPQVLKVACSLHASAQAWLHLQDGLPQRKPTMAPSCTACTFRTCLLQASACSSRVQQVYKPQKGSTVGVVDWRSVFKSLGHARSRLRCHAADCQTPLWPHMRLVDAAICTPLCILRAPDTGMMRWQGPHVTAHATLHSWVHLQDGLPAKEGAGGGALAHGSTPAHLPAAFLLHA